MLRRGEVDPLATAFSTVGDIGRFRDELSKAVKERDELKVRVRELEAEVEALKAREEVRSKLREALTILSGGQAEQ
ncbi:MAG: hypothetical protein B6U73_00415 [Desulfurococcales archaeon ex4484_204]|nr:MAG: hypothetical protein B6U73_00415 [Desulfurococcales archaeon ex4484_204]